jgi:hypothetical protein
LLKQLTKALVEWAMTAELTHHLGYEKHDPSGRGSGNSRNGTSCVWQLTLAHFRKLTLAHLWKLNRAGVVVMEIRGAVAGA